ncbi:MAG: FAD-binding oxidoreductase [Gemmatimonadales bacterium]
MKRRTFVRSSLTAAVAASLSTRRSLAALYQEAPQAPPDVDAITGAGGEVTLKGTDIAELAARMRGRVLLAGDAGYDEARHILNPSFDKYPALIAQPTGTADVRAAVDFARDHDNLLLAVKCGGHSASGKSTCDGGMQIDLVAFRDVRVDPIARRARVTGGSLLGQLDHESMAYDLVVPMGTVSHTGVGGLVTGGGFGRVARRFGLSVDSLTAVDVVTADGQFVRASEDENPDLFWGVRGGGGNFGIVTSFEFALHPMQRRVVGGRVMFPIAKAREVLTFFSEFSQEAPDELDIGFLVFYPPGGADGVAGFFLCYSGPESEAERVLAPMGALGTPTVDSVEAMDYVALQRSGDIDDPRARGSYLKSGFISSMPADLISAIMDGLEGHPARSTGVFLQQSGGAINRVSADATAFAHRDIMGNLLCSVGWRYGDDPSEHVRWIKAYWATLEPFTKGFYSNDLTVDERTAAIHANWGENYPRLVQIKNRYDPGNLFRLNANVGPTV